ncbi:hypothetical protein TIFTF001_042468 [Ficus carica]|uniref:Leucine-rich repeat-containing N-terminal plant-type domain-containing protein n=1 Tax=Ficus carica TaxID=3494 RepID=A0AA87ZZU7_FICCA|nr:hypothetical protein TIFTF001_042468 [Ficus carica]
METRTILCLVLFFATFLQPSLSDSELCHPDDKKVLLEIKKSFNDPDIFVSWDPKTDCCNWTFITCDDNNRVGELTVVDVDCDLVGPIPPEVGDLPYLLLLAFIDCPNLTGTIPPAIAKLNNLQGLGFRNTNISGPIPEFIGDFKDLLILDLGDNCFSGQIPNTIGSLPNLFALNLSFNHFSGPIPGSFEQATSDLSWNSFKFDFSNAVFPKFLFFLDISHNRIFGSLPQGLTDLYLSYFDVGYNKLSGEIPQGGKLQSFGPWPYRRNKGLCGDPLPPCKSIRQVGFI